jgi:hypothetical protein
MHRGNENKELCMLQLLAYFPSFEKTQVSLCDLRPVCVSVYPPICLNAGINLFLLL